MTGRCVGGVREGLVCGYVENNYEAVLCLELFRLLAPKNQKKDIPTMRHTLVLEPGWSRRIDAYKLTRSHRLTGPWDWSGWQKRFDA